MCLQVNSIINLLYMTTFLTSPEQYQNHDNIDNSNDFVYYNHDLKLSHRYISSYNVMVIKCCHSWTWFLNPGSEGADHSNPQIIPSSFTASSSLCYCFATSSRKKIHIAPLRLRLFNHSQKHFYIISRRLNKYSVCIYLWLSSLRLSICMDITSYTSLSFCLL